VKDVVLAIDAGTTRVTALLVDPGGTNRGPLGHWLAAAAQK
jgi:hypothetical protein